MDTKDFLQDPEMWEDKLPQPYRLINNILNDFLDLIWVKIEKKELLRQRAAAKVKVPSGTEGVVLCQQVLTEVCGGIGCGEEEVVVVGNGMSVCVLTCDWNPNDSDGKSEGVMDVVMNTHDECTNVEKKHLEVVDMNSPISRLAFVQKSDVLIVAVQLATGIIHNQWEGYACSLHYVAKISLHFTWQKCYHFLLHGVLLSPRNRNMCITFLIYICAVVKVLALIRGTLTKIAEVSHLVRCDFITVIHTLLEAVTFACQ